MSTPCGIISKKSVEWHQQFYALLYRELEPSHGLYKLKSLHVIRLSNGGYSVGSKCYFPNDGVLHDEVLPRVDVGVYTSGRSKAQQDSARKLLEAAGVHEVGEAEQVGAILKQRYNEESGIPDEKTHRQDLKQFINLVDKQPVTAEMFEEYFIFERKDGSWGKPSQVYLDIPYRDTGLHAWYEAPDGPTNNMALALKYENCGISVSKVAKFAEAVGVSCCLEIVQQQINSYEHPQWDILGQDWVDGVKRSSYEIDEDWTIEHLEKVLAKPSERRILSRPDIRW